jgi:hypothetical protein
MEKHVIRLEQLTIDEKDLAAAIQMEANDEIQTMLTEAQAIAKPIAIYTVCKPERHPECIKLNGTVIPEPFVKKMLGESETVIPYVASCGVEIDAWAANYSDMFAQFVADAIKQQFLLKIMEKLFSDIHSRYFDSEKNISTLNPGSLVEWPLSGQVPLFTILGGVTEDIGVTLSDSLLMTPNKSVSGIMFQTEEAYHNCQLCPRKDCSGRRAPYIGD